MHFTPVSYSNALIVSVISATATDKLHWVGDFFTYIGWGVAKVPTLRVT